MESGVGEMIGGDGVPEIEGVGQVFCEEEGAVLVIRPARVVAVVPENQSFLRFS